MFTFRIFVLALVLPDEARLQQRNLRERGTDDVEDCDEDNHEMGVSCKTEVVDWNSTSYQTDGDF